MYINLGTKDYEVQIEDSDLQSLGPSVLVIDDGYSTIAMYLNRDQLIQLCNGIMEYVENA
jgi:hypothetical protein